MERLPHRRIATHLSYPIFGVWWLLGVVFLVRIPRGVRPGPQAERDLITKLAARG